ncbi:hypothetical protein Ddye_008563 [Dipteronia dyeriana]|uniref:Uncharacterized protein n=1 Tax=Dipteronia dyeriana TaxID=168575 RepID=A0AAE0CLH6_9ROSI|nr:hypothetical protein Ddye_008563 [Dipteronia dyeriana]
MEYEHKLLYDIIKKTEQPNNMHEFSSHDFLLNLSPFGFHVCFDRRRWLISTSICRFPPLSSPTSPSSLPFFPIMSSSSISDHDRHRYRVLKRVCACDLITPSDLPRDAGFDYGMAVGVGGEILLATLEKMVEICDTVFVDIPGL